MARREGRGHDGRGGAVTMDFLLEMTPGNGWLARENDRVVYLSEPESVDVAHDVIEPLLVPREVDASFATMASWIDAGRPLPNMVLFGLRDQVRVQSHGGMDMEVLDQESDTQRAVEIRTAPLAVPLGDVSAIAVNDHSNEASGMLVEGVVRAGGFRIHVHSSLPHAPIDRLAHETTFLGGLALEVDDVRVDVGNGVLLGRWPYKHAGYDPGLETLIIADPAVSRLHAEVKSTETGALLIDRGSHNGTWVVVASSGEHVRVSPDTPFPIGEGDQVALGDTLVRIVSSNP
ncbi:MAG: FHA domain-containing protein [Acidimicrobiales bacterium]